MSILSTFIIEYLTLYLEDEEDNLKNLRANPSQEGEVDVK